MMQRLLLPISILILSISQLAFSQSNASISPPDLQFKDNNVVIVYNIINSQVNETFNVSLEITDGGGRQIIARALSGDIGSNIPGGNDKLITWDLSKEKIQVSEELYFQIIADAVIMNESPQNEISDNTRPTTIDAASEPAGTNTESTNTSITKGSAIFRSMLFPGLGLTKVKGSPHWLKGVIAYGCVGGGVLLHSASTSSYTAYQTETDLTIRDNLYNDALSQRNLSNTLFFGAIGVWAIDFIWTAASSGNNFRADLFPQLKGLELEPIYYPQYQTPALAFKYTF